MILYPTATLTIIAVIIDSSSAEYLGFNNFNPDTSTASATWNTLSYPGYVFRYPTADFTDDNRIMVGANTNPPCSMVIGISSSFTNVDYIGEMIVGTIGRALSYFDDSFGDKRVFTYMEDLNFPN